MTESKRPTEIVSLSKRRTDDLRFGCVCQMWCLMFMQSQKGIFTISICYFYFIYSPLTLSTVFLINFHFICPLQKVFLLFIYTISGKNFAVTSNALYSNLLVQIKLMLLLKPDKGVHLKCPRNLEIVGLLCKYPERVRFSASLRDVL